MSLAIPNIGGAFLKTEIKSGHLGRKSGKGFFDYK
jgi:3-hydroxyacyl-CoA dehydrogenase